MPNKEILNVNVSVFQRLHPTRWGIKLLKAGWPDTVSFREVIRVPKLWLKIFILCLFISRFDCEVK